MPYKYSQPFKKLAVKIKADVVSHLEVAARKP